MRYYPDSLRRPPHAETVSIKEAKRRASLKLSQHTAAFLANGGSIIVVPSGVSSLPGGMPLDNDSIETVISPPTLPGSAIHDAEKVRARARRRAKREGRVVDLRF